MIATIVCVVLLVYLALSAGYRCCKKHWGWILVYLALYCVVLFLSKNDAFASLINGRVNYVFETITSGEIDFVIIWLVVIWVLITVLTLQFAERGRYQSTFLGMYLLCFIVKLSFILYNDASCLLIGIISTVELLFLNPLLGLAAYGESKWYYHFAPYWHEFKGSGSFGGSLLIVSCGLSIISLVYVFIP